VKSALEAVPKGGDLVRVWWHVWIAPVFQGCEPTMEQRQA
jgi:hypothetical protein